ncbi:acetyltransferase [Vaginisenegalia massiliensis]|uniref:acetyltransferase n=1 Tax=Vaginisenegalia massiliensis TaxID=2058294 RepID=UPI000F54A085|nr:acetyltransferase [Vaginisenegalia massiliensis]
MKDRLVIIGAGGHAKVCYEIAKLLNCWRNIIFLDDCLENNYFHIQGPISNYKYFLESDFFVAIGSNEIRKKFITILEESGASLIKLVHPQSIVSDSVSIGAGSVVMGGVVINACSKIGRGCIINTGCTIDHDCNIKDFVHISPGTNVSGSVQIGCLSWLGTGTTVINNIEISEKVIIGAGSVILKNIKDQGTYVGHPCKKIK